MNRGTWPDQLWIDQQQRDMAREYERTRRSEKFNTTPADPGQAGADSQRPDKESEPWTKGK